MGNITLLSQDPDGAYPHTGSTCTQKETPLLAVDALLLLLAPLLRHNPPLLRLQRNSPRLWLTHPPKLYSDLLVSQEWLRHRRQRLPTLQCLDSRLSLPRLLHKNSSAESARRGNAGSKLPTSSNWRPHRPLRPSRLGHLPRRLLHLRFSHPLWLHHRRCRRLRRRLPRWRSYKLRSLRPPPHLQRRLQQRLPPVLQIPPRNGIKLQRPALASPRRLRNFLLLTLPLHDQRRSLLRLNLQRPLHAHSSRLRSP